MNPASRRIAAFAAQFLLVFAALLSLYPVLGPAYQDALAAVAGRVLARARPATRIVRTPDGGRSYLDVTPGGREIETLHLDRTGLRMQTLNLLILPGLLLATPVPLRRRLALLVAGLLLLFVAESAVAVAWAPTARCLLLAPDDRLCAMLFYALVTAGQVIAFAIWGLLTWHVWLPVKPRPRPA